MDVHEPWVLAVPTPLPALGRWPPPFIGWWQWLTALPPLTTGLFIDSLLTVLKFFVYFPYMFNVMKEEI